VGEVGGRRRLVGLENAAEGNKGSLRPASLGRQPEIAAHRFRDGYAGSSQQRTANGLWHSERASRGRAANGPGLVSESRLGLFE
jgi:hypothetical protein